MVTKVVAEFDDLGKCRECPFKGEIPPSIANMYNTRSRMYYCMKLSMKTIDDLDSKRLDCPLKPAPKRFFGISATKLINDAKAKGVQPAFASGYREGWNACVEYLENESEGIMAQYGGDD